MYILTYFLNIISKELNNIGSPIKNLSVAVPTLNCCKEQATHYTLFKICSPLSLSCFLDTDCSLWVKYS